MNVALDVPLDAPSRRTELRRRASVLGAVLAADALLYACVFVLLYRGPPNAEHVFAEGEPAPPFNICVSLIDMDPVREELRVHLDFATIEGPHVEHYPGVPDRDLIVHVGDGRCSPCASGIRGRQASCCRTGGPQADRKPPDEGRDL